MTQAREIIAVHVYPKSAKEAVEGPETDASGKEWLKIRVTSPPEDGKANKAMISLLAKHLGCAKSSLRIISGESSRYKLVEKNA